ERLSEIIAVVDHNKLQSDSAVSAVSDLGRFEDKFRAFGWDVRRVDDHDLRAIHDAFSHFATVAERPKVPIADTSTCKGEAFKEELPDRFIECGIAEQHMVSAAGGMALNGLLPVVHSFACFLSTRANEHIYNNATERRKIIYTATLAGLVPGGPGHSHQSL